MGKNDGKIAKTDLGRDGKPDHTTYSYGGLRRSFNSDKGENIRDDHYHENGPNADPKGVTPDSSPHHGMGKDK